MNYKGFVFTIPFWTVVETIKYLYHYHTLLLTCGAQRKMVSKQKSGLL